MSRRLLLVLAVIALSFSAATAATTSGRGSWSTGCGTVPTYVGGSGSYSATMNVKACNSGYPCVVQGYVIYYSRQTGITVGSVTAQIPANRCSVYLSTSITHGGARGWGTNSSGYMYWIVYVYSSGGRNYADAFSTTPIPCYMAK